MKRQDYRSRVMVLGTFVALALGMAHAQIGGDVLKVNVPFDFSIGSQKLQAGEYSLRPLLPHTMVLRNQAGQVLTNVQTMSVESGEVQKSVKLVFNGYGGEYFLTQIWNAGENIGQALTKSPAEIEMATKHSPGAEIALRLVAHR